MKDSLVVSSSPHIRHRDTTSGIMLDVIIALIPATVYGIIIFGISAAAVVCTCVLSAIVFEFLWNIILKKPQSVGDFSAIVTGLLLGLNLPPKTPLFVAAIGSFAAIIVVKQMFGGLGYNFVNPAIGARIVLLVSFPTAMASAGSYLEPISKLGVDTVSSATPLMLYGKEAAPSLKSLFFGMNSGAIGETSAFLLLLGGIYLVLRKVINPIIPVSFIGTVAVMTYLFSFNINETLYFVLSGGLFLGAIFMATDYVTSPTTNLGKLVFGIGCGLITFVIRKWGNLPEGVSYSIILMNILAPQIDKLTRRKPFGLPKEG
ncbi:MAG: RnfABCDGE type electron transport complex subunit D [Clostridia bacterium]|nr:RnfABCDGE type electron transport complex subunit D [Clostridia bacterium]